MPFYNTATAASALDVSPKWLDNLLSHNTLDDLESESQGVARRLSFGTIMIVMLARDFVDSMAMPSSAALKLATRLLATTNGELAISPQLSIDLDVDALRSTVLTRLARAVETSPTPRRGRPPKR
jgi:hypothetical protein